MGGPLRVRGTLDKGIYPLRVRGTLDKGVPMGGLGRNFLVFGV